MGKVFFLLIAVLFVALAMVTNANAALAWERGARRPAIIAGIFAALCAGMGISFAGAAGG